MKRLYRFFLIGAGIIAVGLVLQLSIGPVRWSMFAWPVNIIVLAALLMVIAAVFMLRKRVEIYRLLGTCDAAIPAICYAAVLTVVMGLTRQATITPNSFGENLWLRDMLSFWPFVLIYTYVVIILGQAILKRLTAFGRRWKQNTMFLLHHAGLFIVLVTATLGHADMKKVQVWTTTNSEAADNLAGVRLFSPHGCYATDGNGWKAELPMVIGLKRFVMETYPDGMPRRYASEVVISGHTSTIEVNKPLSAKGWNIYQMDYRETPLGDECQISILELVRDPWQPWVYAGVYMMLAGAVLLILSSLYKAVVRIITATPRSRTRDLAIMMLLVFIVLFAYHMSVKGLTQRPPALQSPWFVPHIVAYMTAYTLLGAAIFRSKLAYAGLAFMTIGMLFGALWAKEAWGHYWSWDPKETWAAATWLGYLCYIHCRRRFLLVVCFLLLQVCWWGINYLPSAQGVSVHTY